MHTRKKYIHLVNAKMFLVSRHTTRIIKIAVASVVTLALLIISFLTLNNNGFQRGMTYSCFLRSSMFPEPIEMLVHVRSAVTAHYLEQGHFPNSFDEMGLGRSEETPQYRYSFKASKYVGYLYAISKRSELCSFVGSFFLHQNRVQINSGAYGDMLFEEKSAYRRQFSLYMTTIFCRTEPGVTRVNDPYVDKSSTYHCGVGTKLANICKFQGSNDPEQIKNGKIPNCFG